jgi:hypothetical protein
MDSSDAIRSSQYFSSVTASAKATPIESHDQGLRTEVEAPFSTPPHRTPSRSKAKLTSLRSKAISEHFRILKVSRGEGFGFDRIESGGGFENDENPHQHSRRIRRKCTDGPNHRKSVFVRYDRGVHRPCHPCPF